MSTEPALSRRERQIMDAVYARRQATAAEVRAAIAGAPSYSAVRAMLRILEEKGHLKHQEMSGKYIYMPTQKRGNAARSALRGMLKTFFDNSTSKAVAALLDASDSKLTAQELDDLERLIKKARQRGTTP
ncbi:MAG TPA: BlaI/MecI/CopY family transcriptional regulator [Tepidisphaeraceae bacterium]